ncbi:L-gulonolactone oxidase 3 [Ananas comosus]|uniref:L-gulonolactone oxidase n=1 Tax=Ananas comosus TaxID=4615 RepID=A0A199W448_ANACO|nr:L-gulonolactone oxidase 3 [Ananas comosus]OAY84089.1 L-gulonolactone oxidase 3 [Ananas comosus]
MTLVLILGFLLLQFLLLLLSPPHAADSLPPASPIRCDENAGCVVSNAYGAWNDRRTECRAGSAVYPTTEAELLSAVAASRDSKAKVATAFSHTIPKLACPQPGGNSSNGSTTSSVLISTAQYRQALEFGPADRTVTATSGWGLREVIDAAEERGMSLAAAPYWEGVSVGGMVATGAHGSSWWGRGGAVHDAVDAVSVVVPAGCREGFAKVVRLRRGDPGFGAAVVSLGLLGVVSQVTFSLEPRFKRSITYRFQDNSSFEDEFTDLARSHEFADITWYPSQHTAVYRLDDRVPINTSGNGVNDFIGFQSNPILVSTAVRATEKALEKSKNIKGKCTVAKTEIAYKKLVGNGLKNEGIIFTGYPVVGYQGKMQTSGSCLHSSKADPLSMCAWDPRIKGLFFYETTAIFAASKFKDFILDVKKLRNLNPDNFCGVDIYNGFLIRFIKSSEAYLGQNEDSVVVDFNYYRADDPLTPRLNQDVWEEVEQMAFFKHGARPHWAKNRKVAFLGVQNKYPKMDKFITEKKRFDPTGIFDSVLSDEILFGKESEKYDGCALDGQCICSEDTHCSPSQGYLCKPGLVYQEAMVCRYTDSTVQ